MLYEEIIQTARVAAQIQEADYLRKRDSRRAELHDLAIKADLQMDQRRWEQKQGKQG